MERQLELRLMEMGQGLAVFVGTEVGGIGYVSVGAGGSVLDDGCGVETDVQETPGWVSWVGG